MQCAVMAGGERGQCSGMLTPVESDDRVADSGGGRPK